MAICRNEPNLAMVVFGGVELRVARASVPGMPSGVGRPPVHNEAIGRIGAQHDVPLPEHRPVAVAVGLEAAGCGRREVRAQHPGAGLRVPFDEGAAGLDGQCGIMVHPG